MVKSKFTFSRFIFFDTNILSNICVKTEIFRPLFNYLFNNDLTIAVSDGILAELSQATRKHDDLKYLFMFLPSALIKSFEMVIQEEIQSYPNVRSSSLLYYPLSHPSYANELRRSLSSKELAKARRIQLSYAKRVEQRHTQLKTNFPPSKTGKYRKVQASDFARKLTLQWLEKEHPLFIKQFIGQLSKLKSQTFLSLQLYSYVLFYKYYLQGRIPKTNDFGDMFNVFYIPYCKKAVLEKDMCEILRQIKLNHNILNNVDIFNIDFIRQFEG